MDEMKKPAEEPKDEDLLKEEKDAAKEKAKKVKAKPKKVVENVPVPFLVEFGITFSTAFLIVADLAVAGVSYFSGARLLDIIIRTCVSTVVLGTLLWFFTMQLSNGALKAAYAEQKEHEKSPADKDLPNEQLHDFKG
jgi:hypothetical protein